MKRVKNALILILLVLLLVGSLGNTHITSVIFVVDSSGDEADLDLSDLNCATNSGRCTLRAALEQAAEINGVVTIQFNIPGEGPVRVIAPEKPLPVITQQIIIDGNTQPENVQIQLDGSKMEGEPGLVIRADNCSLLGLMVINFETGIWIDDSHGTSILDTTVRNSSLDGILITNGGENRIGDGSAGSFNYFGDNGRNGIQVYASNGNHISGNVIGLLSGSVESPNAKNGILLTEGSQFNIIGGSNEDQTNYITSNLLNQVQINNLSNNNFVTGNYIQIKPDGSMGTPSNNYPLEIRGSSYNQIGGSGEFESNYICGGIKIGPDDLQDINSFENLIYGNQIGTLPDGRTPCSPEIGLYLKNSYQNEVKDNFIAGYVITGITLEGPLADRNTIQGNSIGLAVDGTPLAGVTGISIYKGNDNLIGGPETSLGNKIAFNSGNGISMESKTILEGYIERYGNNRINANSIFENGGLGIELHPEIIGHSLNDLHDLDEGPNHLQNYPEFHSAVYNGSSLVLDTFLSVRLNEMKTFSLDFFLSNACDPSGYGEGEEFIYREEVQSDYEGSVNVEVTIPMSKEALGQVLTATATDSEGNTSEFSECVEIRYPYDVFLPLIVK